MRKLLLKLIERLQKRLDSKKDDPRDWEWIKKEFDCKGKDMIVEIDRRDICNMLAGAEPSYEQMGRIEGKKLH